MKIVLIGFGIAAAALACTVVGCKMFAGRSTESKIPLTAKPQGKIAIVYYSQSQVQNTALVAKWIQKQVGGDLIPLELVKPYPEPYGETLKAADAERAAKTHPQLKPFPSLDGYDIVFVGAPIWYGTYAAPLMTFFDSNKLAGKTVAPFCTHGGGGAKNFFADVAKACPGAKVLDEADMAIFAALGKCRDNSKHNRASLEPYHVRKAEKEALAANSNKDLDAVRQQAYKEFLEDYALVSQRSAFRDFDRLRVQEAVAVLDPADREIAQRFMQLGSIKAVALSFKIAPRTYLRNEWANFKERFIVALETVDEEKLARIVSSNPTVFAGRCTSVRHGE